MCYIKVVASFKMNHALILVYGECIRVIQQDFKLMIINKEIMVLRKHKHYMSISNIVICILYITYSTRTLTPQTDKIKKIAMCVYV